MTEVIDADDLVRDAQNYLKRLADCCMSGDVCGLIDSIVEVSHFEESEGDGPSGGVIARLQDGRWIAVEDNQDYTGHGCQCGTDASVHADYDTAVRLGIGEGLRRSFGIPDNPKWTPDAA